MNDLMGHTSADDSPLRISFPDYWNIDSFVRGEVEGLSDSILDWTSAKYGWAGWSIRQQTSHMASLIFRWLLINLRSQLFPEGRPITNDELETLSSVERRLSDEVFSDINDILNQVDRAVSLARSVLQNRSIRDGRKLSVSRPVNETWKLMGKAHPNGVAITEDGAGSMTLEAVFRHMYFEYLTHLYNIQRIKRALGLSAIVKLPNSGYHTVQGWDVSEAVFGSEKFR